MILGIDASNIRRDGGLTYLVELLRAADPASFGIRKVVVWGGTATLGRIEERSWLEKRCHRFMDGSLSSRAIWQTFVLSREARTHCDGLFVPGGLYVGAFRPFVTISRNMLPFEWEEARRYGFSLAALRLLILRLSQVRTFRRADGLIFLMAYARNTILPMLGKTRGSIATIPHGIANEFMCKPREQRPLSEYDSKRRFKVIYVSTVDAYKHQWLVAEAVAALQRQGMAISLDLIGPAYPTSLARLKKVLLKLDPAGEYITYRGAVPHKDLRTHYFKADLCLFASSCENMPNILLEGMASGLPIVCSSRGPMPEVLGQGGVYFDPLDTCDIERALRQIIESVELRTRLASISFSRVQQYSWTRCANETFGFLSDVMRKFKGKSA